MHLCACICMLLPEIFFKVVPGQVEPPFPGHIEPQRWVVQIVICLPQLMDMGGAKHFEALKHFAIDLDQHSCQLAEIKLK